MACALAQLGGLQPSNLYCIRVFCTVNCHKFFTTYTQTQWTFDATRHRKCQRTAHTAQLPRDPSASKRKWQCWILIKNPSCAVKERALFHWIIIIIDLFRPRQHRNTYKKAVLCRMNTVQYSPLYATCVSLDPPESSTQTTSRSLQLFLQGSLGDRPTGRPTAVPSVDNFIGEKVLGGCPSYSYVWRFSSNGLWCVLWCREKKSIQTESRSSLYIVSTPLLYLLPFAVCI